MKLKVVLKLLPKGYESGKRPEEKVQLTCKLKVREMNALSVWSKRFCVLCGARLFVFPSSRPKGKPSLVLDLTGGKMVEYKHKKSYYCVKVSASRRDVLLSFDTRLEQSKWLERAAKVCNSLCLSLSLSLSPSLPPSLSLVFHNLPLKYFYHRPLQFYTLLHPILKVMSKHPLEANLSGYSLERVPKFFFLNYYLVAMNLSRNIMKARGRRRERGERG